MIIRFIKRTSIVQIRNYSPNSNLENIYSWKHVKDLIIGIAKEKDGKLIEIGEDRNSKQEAKTRYYKQRKLTKRKEKDSNACNQSLYDIVELKKELKKNGATTKHELTAVLFEQRPDLIRTRNEGLKLANELSQNARMKRLTVKAASTKWREWQSWFIEKATKQEIDSREVLVVYDRIGNTGKSFLRSNFSLLYPNETCNLQNGYSQNMFHAAGKVDELKYVLMDLSRSDINSVNYSAIEQIKNGNFDTCKYNNENICFDPPFFAIFTNFKLDWWSLSLDRWSLLYINKDHTFKHFKRYDRSMKPFFKS